MVNAWDPKPSPLNPTRVSQWYEFVFLRLDAHPGWVNISLDYVEIQYSTITHCPFPL